MQHAQRELNREITNKKDKVCPDRRWAHRSGLGQTRYGKHRKKRYYNSSFNPCPKFEPPYQCWY